MNIKQCWSQVGILAGDPALANLRITEIISWLNMAQDVISPLIIDAQSWAFEKTYTATTVTSQAAYTLPTDCSEVVLVRYDSSGAGTTLYQANLLPLRDRMVTTDNSLYAASNREPWYSLLGTSITVYPTPTTGAASCLEITYRRRCPELRLDRVKETITTTSAGTATTLVSTALTEADDYWNDCEVEVTSGTTAIYQKQVCSDFTASSDTVTVRNAFTAAPGNGVTFNLIDKSILPDEHHYLMTFFAAGMACGKLGNQAGFDRYMGMWNAGLGAIREKFAKPVQMQLYDGERMSKTNV